MELFDKMVAEAERASRDEDLPDALLDQIKSIRDNNEKYAVKSDLIDDLIERLEDYEPFADVGCGNESYSTADVQRVVDKILE